MYDSWNFFKTYKELFPDSLNKNLLESIKFILGKNIIHGDSLNFKNPNTKKPIIFSEWSMVGAKVKRRDFVLEFQNTYNTMYGITPITTIETSVNTEEQFEENVVADRITGATSGGTAIGSWLGKAIRKFF